jgi:DNA primase
MVADIKQRELRGRYVAFLARHVGVDAEEGRDAVNDALRHGRRGPDVDDRPVPAAVAPNSPRALVEREALKLAVQHPQLAGPLFDAVDATPYGHPVHAAVREAIAAAGGAASAAGGPTWIEQVRSGCVDLAGQALVTELAVEPLRYDGEPDPRYVSVTLASLQLPVIEQRIKAVKSKLQRTNPVQHKDEYLSLFGEVASLEQHAQALREQATGGL